MGDVEMVIIFLRLKFGHIPESREFVTCRDPLVRLRGPSGPIFLTLSRAVFEPIDPLFAVFDGSAMPVSVSKVLARVAPVRCHTSSCQPRTEG